ncbi:MAG: polysaccharide biosynthesis tyrosine autokinase [Anaerolineae bacterium]|nr:polysaccharide biosynthesis tyrosine autokinase [Anaerolineae bacterium]
MELIQYIRLLKKWLWLIIIFGFLAGGISFIINAGRPPVYEAQTTIAIGRFIEAPNPDSAQIRTGIELAQTYAQILKTYDVLNGTIEALNLSLSVDELERLTNVRILTGTSLLVVRVTYTDPVLAADIANSLADQLVLTSPSNLTAQEEEQIAFATEQIAALNTQITDSRRQLALIDDQLQTATGSEAIDQLNGQRNSIVDQINQATATVADFTNTIVTLQQRTNSIDVVERARIPTSPSGSSVWSTTLLGALVGAFLAIGLALVIEYLDETIRSTEEAAQTLKLPVLSGIIRFGTKKDAYPERLVTKITSMSPIAESYRTLRTNLLYQGGADHKSVFLVTSPGPGEGKSVTTANLAVTMAQAGLQVLLIDADLRRPKQHEIFGLNNNVGLTTLLGAEPLMPNQHDRAASSLPFNLLDCMQFTNLPKLWIITSGFIPANPTEILSSTLLKRWIDTFRASSDIDVILIDSPPCLMAADSPVLAATARAEVVLIVDRGRTRRSAAVRAKEQFESLGITVKGVVVNRINPRDENQAYGYYYGYGYELPVDANSQNQPRN